MDKFFLKPKPVSTPLHQPSVTHQLTERSWVEFWPKAISCTQAEFDEFWALHPETRHEIMIMGKLTAIPRFQKLYGAGEYRFSGTVMPGDPVIPVFVQRCLDLARRLYPEYREGWNGALVNWYADGSNYIGPHSDDTRDLVPGAPILSFSFGSVRTFRVKKKTEAEDEEIAKVDFPTEPGSLLAMCGDMQNEYKHEITKTAKAVGPRINVTIRCFNNV